MSASPAVDSATTPAKQPNHHEGSFRDTIESILIAFILAFIFRAFVVEAFVIPTGSMAPTLLGAHARFTCGRCGYQFESNFSSGGDEQNIPAEAPHRAFPSADCPNCAYQVHDQYDNEDVRPVPIHYGDRILVLKYAYLFKEPDRWDVVVFKSPDDPTPEGSGWYVTNFIKRLVGKPGETVMVLDGDVYIRSAGSTALSDFKVQRKPRHVQDALWRIVYDNEFVPTRDLNREDNEWRQPWHVESGSGWNLGTDEQPRRVFTFDGTAAGTAGTIRFDNDANGERAFTDWLGYVQPDNQRSKHNVSDVKVSMLYHRQRGDGPLRIQFTKLGDTFTAELTRGVAKLYRKPGGAAEDADPNDLGTEIAAAPRVRALGDSPVVVEFMNCDYELTLRVGGIDVLRGTYEPDIAALHSAHVAGRDHPKPVVRITASEQACELSHLSLWRDVYYTNGPWRPYTPDKDPGGIIWGVPEAPMALGKDEYFVLGDNTIISADARYWDKAIHLDAEDLHVEPGRVPKRFLLGKAFFVYWPAGYRPMGHSRLPGVIPNFGDMRFIQ